MKRKAHFLKLTTFNYGHVHDNVTLSKVELFFTHQFMNNLRFFDNLDKENILNKEINKLENLIKN